MKSLLADVARRTFNERAFDMMDHVEYRRVKTLEDLQAVADLRKKAFDSHGIEIGKPDFFASPSDLEDNVYVFAVYLNERLVASMRIEILSDRNRHSNIMSHYADILSPLLDQGCTFMDPARLVVDPAFSGGKTALPHVTMRLGFLAAKAFDCDFCLCMLRKTHAPFYRKVFQATQISAYRKFDFIEDAYALFSSPKSMEEAICSNYPIFRSTETERRLLFDSVRPGEPERLSVRPTARLAVRQHAERQKRSA